MKNSSRRKFLVKTGISTAACAINRVLSGIGGYLLSPAVMSSTASSSINSAVPISVAASGVNVSGLEWNSITSRLTGMSFNLGGNLSVTQDAYFKYLSLIGVKKIRLPVMWEAIQPVLFDANISGGVAPYVTSPGMLHTELVAIIQRNLASCANYGMTLILDIHNYGSYYDFNYQDGGTWSNPAATTWYKAYAGSISTGTATFTAGSKVCTLDKGTLAVGQPITFSLGTNGVLPPEISPGTVYYVVSSSGVAVNLANNYAGTAISFSKSSSGTINRSQPDAIILKSFDNGLLDSAHMADLFTRLVAAFDSYPALAGYGLMNEISAKSGEAVWMPIANATIAAIRKAGSTKKVFVDGPYTNAATAPYTAAQVGNVIDPASNFSREVHWYLDANRSGSYFDWAYDQIRGFCVDIAGATGNLPIVGSVRGQSLTTLRQFVSAPVFVGEVGIPHTNNIYYAIANDFISAARKIESDVCLWGASQNLYFPAALLIRPYIKGQRLLPSPAVSAILYDAGIQNAKIVSYIDINTNTLTIEAYGSLIETLNISVTDASGLTLFSTTTVTLMPGVLSSATITFKISAARTYALFSFHSSSTTIAAPPPVVVLNYQSNGLGDISQGRIVLQNTKASIFVAGTGLATLAGGAPVSTEALVPNAGLSDERFGLNNLIASPNGMVALATGLGSKKAWHTGRTLNAGEYRDDFLTNTYTKPSTKPGNYTGLTPPHQAIFTTKSTNWYFACTFDRQSSYMSGNICGVYNSGDNYGIAILGNNTTVSLAINDNAYGVYLSGANIVPENTKITCIITVNNGLAVLYTNGKVDATATFTANDSVLDNFSVLGGLVNYYPVYMASANIRVYSTAIGFGTITLADIAGMTKYFNQ